MYKIAVLMSSFNGEKFILQQIESIVNQKNVDVHLYIRDDGSIDDTLKIIEKVPNDITIFQGENIGFKDSFSFLIWNNNIQADFYAFSDQDDVWDQDKLISAITQLSSVSGIGMYASNQRVVDDDLVLIKPLYGLKKNDIPFQNHKNFKDFFLNNNYFGNTIVLNSEAMSVIRDYKPPRMQVQHDTWVSIVVYLCGTIIFDEDMHSSYRQHTQNLVGGLQKKQSIIHKIQTFLTVKSINNILATMILDGYESKLNNDDRIWLMTISALPKLDAKIKLIIDKNVKKRTLYQTLVLKVLILFAKF